MATLDDALAALGDSTDAIADTQSTPSYAMPKVQQKAAPTMDDALATLEPDQNEPLRDAVNLGTQKDSAKSTKVLQLFGKTGLPRDFIERNQDFVQQESDKQDFNPDKLMKDSPAFASWLSEHPDHVAAAKPDVQALSLIEKQLRNIPAQFEKGQQTVEYGDVMMGIVDGLLGKTDVSALRKRQADLEASMSKPDPTGLADETGVGGIAQRAPGWMAQQLPVLSRTLQEQVKTGATGLAVGAAGGAAVGGAPGALAGGLAVGAASWRVGAALSSAKMEFGQAFGEYEKLKDENGQPLDQQTAMGLAGMVGVVNGSIDGFFGIEGLTSKLPGINQFTRDGIKELLKTPTTRAAVLSAARTVGQVMATEGATEAIQMYITKAGGVALQAVKDGGAPSDWLGKIFTAENLKQAATEAEAGAFGGGGIASVMATPGLAGDIAKVRQANKAKQAFESIGKATEGAKFAQDLPDSLKEIISRATKDGPIEQVYVPSESFNTYFQKEGVDPREVYKEITGNVDAYDQAAQTGADLPIQTADYVKNLAGTKHNEFFAKELRTDIDAMNAREAEQWVKDQDAQAEADAAAIAQPGTQTLNTADPAAEVRKDIAGQLQAAGFDPTVVDQYAGLFESRYRARAERRGLGETAADLFRQNNLSITRPIPDVLKTLGGNVSELDALLNRLRVGDVPKPQEVFGQSLFEFLKEKGGIQDQGGELSAKNVDANRQAFKKNLVQKGGKTLDDAATSAYEAGYIASPDIANLLEAIDQEAHQNPVYAIGKENTRALDTQTNLESLKTYLDSKGIDLANTPNADIKKLFGEAVQQPLPGAEGQTFSQRAPATKEIPLPDGRTLYKHGDLKTDEGNFSAYDVEKKGPRGRASMFTVHKSDDGYVVRNALIPDTEQRKGIATAFYSAMNKESLARTGNPLRSTQARTLSTGEVVHELSPDAVALWDSFVHAGVAEKLGEKNYRFKQQPLPGAEGQTFAQTFNEGDKPKGSITFGDGQVNIKLFEKADLSTFLHESAHLYFDELITDATTPGVTPQLTADLDTMLKWMGLSVRVADGADAIKGAIKTKHHEQFARGFEAYTMEGKSPSQAMREAFATFRQWLIQAYRSLTTAPLNVKLTKDVREVLDRMIATDTEIDAAAQEAEVHPLFTTAVSAGMSTIEFAAYQETVKEASMTARETLQKQLMAQYQRKHEKWWKTELEATRAKILEQVNEHPEYVALSVLQTGTMPDGRALPDGIEPMKLDRKAIADQFGADFLTTMPTGTMRKGGMHQDTAAPLFGFNSGQEMVLAMVNARPKFDLVNAQADQVMQDKYGDMRFDGSIAEAARAAVMNEHQEKVIAAEIRALNAKAREVKPFVKAAQDEAKGEQKAGKALLRTMIPSLEDTRTLARNILSRMTLKKMNPYSYSVAARQASKRATEALASDDYIDAGIHKQRELLNLAMFREALIIKEQIEKTHDLASNFAKADSTLAKSRNVDLINVGRAILAQYGLGPESDKTAAEHLDPIKNYDKDLYDQWKPQVDALAPRPLDYNALTVEEFLKLDDNLKALWLLSLRTQQIKVNGELVDRRQVVDELAAVMASFTTQQKSKVVGAQTPWADTKLGLLSWKSALSRVESWVDAMDRGDINGVFRKVIWTPISEASNQFRAGKKDMIQKYLAIIKPIEGTITRDLIAAPELGPGVSFRGKTALLHAILHTGNDSNQQKLLRGYGWDASAWQTFLDRMHRDKVLTKADYDYAQGVWDLLESIKPQAQQAHHEMYGYYFNEITAKELTTPFGKYKGGYVPAIADRVQSVDQAIREEKDLFDQAGNSYMFPTTGKGFTKSRVEEYAAPLALDLTTIPLHLDKTMRFVHLEPRVKDAARLITNKRLRSALDAMDSTAAKDMLVPWLQRSAQQTVSTPGRNRHADQMFRYLRKASGAQIMVGNVLNTLQQFTGFSLSLTKVKARHMRGAMVNYLRHPVQYGEDISSRSAFMKGRTSTQVMEIQQTIDDILLNPTKYEKARKFADRHGYFMQQGAQNVVDLITWGAAYDQAHAQNLDERMAVRSADAAVRQTQGSFAPEDLSNFEAGTPFTRAFTMFYSYFNMQANLLGTEFGKLADGLGVRKHAGRAFYLYFVGFMIPAILAESIVKGVGGFDPDDDDDYLNEALSVFFGSQLRSALAFFPGVGPITLAGINAFNDKWYDDRISTSPAVSLLESGARVPHSLYKAMSEDGHSKRAVRDVLTLIGLVTGLPAGALSKPFGYLADVNDGKANPEDAGDVARGLLSGRDVNRKK